MTTGLAIAHALSLFACAPAFAQKSSASVELSAQLATPAVLADKPQTTFLKIGLKGQRPEQAKRTPVNIAIVLDRSGSMQGDKLTEAKRAAVMAVRALQPDDVVSIVAYDSVVEVPVPATRAAEKDHIIAAIEAIEAGSSTALFAGVSMGASELRKFFEQGRVNRIILLSDGMANVGPSSPGELAELGKSLAKQGVSVTTIGLGLGYNEDLMFQLALASDGNHAFVENAEALATIFKSEFGDVFSVVAQDVVIELDCDRARPVRVIGRDALIAGSKVTARLNQLYAGQEKLVMLEVELQPVPAGTRRDFGEVKVRFADMQTNSKAQLEAKLSASGVASAAEVERLTNKDVMVEAVALLATEQNRVALALRDEGKVDAARELLQKNQAYVRDNAVRFKSKKLEKIEKRSIDSANNLDEANWNRTRKQMRKYDFEEMTQQSY